MAYRIISATIGLMVSAGAAFAADPIPAEDNGIRFLLESQSSYVFLGGEELGASSEDGEYSTTAGVARLNVDLGNGLNLQGDLFGELAWSDDDSDDAYGSSVGGGVHAYTRSEAGALGVFGALANVDINNDDDSSGAGGLAYAVGAEGLWFAEQLTLGAQLGLIDSDRSDDLDLIRDAVFVRGLARYYIGESTLLQGEAAFLSGENDTDSTDLDIISVGGRIQHELDFFPGNFNWPGKVYLAYRGDFYDQQGEGKIESHTILFGTTFTFGHSLVDNERNGAAFDLPAFARWNSIAAGALE
jgi:hypothetical protein